VILIGLLSGASSGAFGIGGGVLSTALLRLVLQISPGFAIGSTIPAQFLGAAFGSATYVRKRMADFALVRAAAPYAVAGTMFGAYATKFLHLDYLMVLLSLILIWIGALIFRKSFVRIEPPPGKPGPGNPFMLPAAATGSGLIGGLLGLGGGILLGPAFNLLLKRNIKESVASSLVIVAITSVPNLIIHWVLGHIQWQVALSLLIGQMATVSLGALFTIRSHRRLVYFVFGLFLLGVSLSLARMEIVNIYLKS
jgi:hypothetical protein